MSDYNVRLIRQNELRALLDLYQHFDNGDPVLEDSEQLDQLWEAIYNNPSIHYVVVEKDGKLVSTCHVVIIKNLTRGAMPYALIENVVTHRDYRNKGYGKAAVNMAIEIAKNNHCYKVMLMTGSKKEETLNFYRSLGFRDDTKKGFQIRFKH